MTKEELLAEIRRIAKERGYDPRVDEELQQLVIEYGDGNYTTEMFDNYGQDWIIPIKTKE
jgi:hypothetical protein